MNSIKHILTETCKQGLTGLKLIIIFIHYCTIQDFRSCIGLCQNLDKVQNCSNLDKVQNHRIVSAISHTLFYILFMQKLVKLYSHIQRVQLTSKNFIV